MHHVLLFSVDENGNTEAPYSIDVFEDWIYGTTYSTNKVFRLNKFGQDATPPNAFEFRYIIPSGLTHTKGILAVQKLKQESKNLSLVILVWKSSVWTRPNICVAHISSYYLFQPYFRDI